LKTASSLLTTDYIKHWCSLPSTYQRGIEYFQQGRVDELEFDPKERVWHAIVVGSEEYDVKVRITDDDILADCDCPAFDKHWMCKHAVAVLLEIKKQQAKTSISGAQWDPWKYNKTDQIIDSFAQKFDLTREGEDRQTSRKQPLLVEYLCKTRSTGTYGTNNLLRLELKVGVKRPYVVKNIYKFLQAVEDQASHMFTNNFSYDPFEHTFLSEDLEIIQILQIIKKQEDLYYQSGFYRGYYGGKDNERSLLIPPLVADSLFSKLQERNASFEEGPHVVFRGNLNEHPLPLTFRLEKGDAEDFQLDLRSLKSVTYFEPYGWLVQQGAIYKLSAAQKSLLNEIESLHRQPGEKILPVSQDQIGKLISYVVPRLKQIGWMDIAAQVSDQIISPKLHIKLFLDRQEEILTTKAEFHYGNIIIDPFHPTGIEEIEKGIILMREMEKEQGFMRCLEGIPIEQQGEYGYLEGEDEIYEFLFTVLPQIEKQAEVYMTQAVRSLILPSNHTPVTRIDLNSSGNLLEIQFDMAGIEAGQIRQILQSVVEKKKYHRLPNGAFVSLEDDAFQPIDRLFSEFHINKTQIHQGILHFPVYRSLQIDDLVGKANHYSTKVGKAFRRFVQNLKNPDSLDFPLPANLHAKLRDYQQFGFQWLKTLANYGLGGILADDMGLGKTLQAIAYLLSERSEEQNEKKPSLVIAPASLVYNWKSEFEKFAPHLNVGVVYGTPEERIALLRDGQPDVFITSYPLLRQDFEFYEKMSFDSLILDEAQAIKNHLTKTAKAVKEIAAAKRFALSGTPIENSLDELWSIFDAILPGFFPNHKTFKNLAQEKIAQMVRPFILRRLKKDVLTELPDKIETVHQSELTKTQKGLYVGYLQRIQEETKESIQNEGFDKSRMKILAGLTRLRQICCHPKLFVENYNGQSGKLEQFLEIIENALENNRRLLVFSQFTSMLQLIRKELDGLGMDYFYLDGQTPSKDRVEMADQFNQGQKELFLISLKAGGTGLNLTGADTVILYDLWWNPAVEEQAAGRAHRMGQKNSVQVMRLIARGTIEEKIYELQQKKKELIEQVIQPGEAPLSSLSEEEIRDLLGI
jgi:superfamily II DNA or RNA helicase